MASKKPAHITPKFTENADLQAALERRYAGAQSTIASHVRSNQSLAETIYNLSDLAEGKFIFSTTGWDWVASEDKDDNGYFDPIGQITLNLEVKRGRGKSRAKEDLTLQVNIDGKFKITSSNGQINTETSSPALAANTVEGWHLAMQEEHDFSTEAAIAKKRQQQTKADAKPRVEKK